MIKLIMKKNLLELLRGNKTQADMAQKYKVSQQTWSSWETGRTIPDHEIMLNFEVEYGIPMEVIFFEAFNYKMKLTQSEQAS